MPHQEIILANDILADKQILNRKNRAKKKDGKEKFRTRVARAWQCDGKIPCAPCLLQGRSCQAKPNRRRKKTPIEETAERLLKATCGRSNKKSPLGSEESISSPPSTILSSLQSFSPEVDHWMEPGESLFPDLDPQLINQAEWASCFDVFCRDVHPQYPFLHIPTLQSDYSEISKLSPLSPGFSFQSEMHRFQISRIFVCMAIGRFCESSYSEATKGSCPGGWGLYSAALNIQPKILSSKPGPSNTTLVSQTIVLLVIYLCYVGSTEDARQLFALAISHLHNVGSHQGSKLHLLPVFEDELLRRLWCCVYVLERELGLQIKGPLLIQDSNVEFAFPRNFNDQWLSKHLRDSKTSSDLCSEIEEEVSKTPSVLVSSLSSMTWHARAANRVWGTLYPTLAANTDFGYILIERMESLVQKAETLGVLRTQTDNHQSSSCENTSLGIKHRTLMQVVCQISSLSALIAGLRLRGTAIEIPCQR
ncbi:unnamed protein product [Penicillium olsonii]|nr:unnamed protein product [Penicillium olsonii]